MLSVVPYFANDEDGVYGDIYKNVTNLRIDHPTAKILTGFGVRDSETGMSPEDAADWYATEADAQAYIDRKASSLSTEDERIAAAQRAGRKVAQFEIKEGHTEPRNWDRDGVQNATAFSHLAAVGFSRLGTRMYSIPFVDAYREEYSKLTPEPDEDGDVTWGELEYRPEGYFYIERLKASTSEYWPYNVEPYNDAEKVNAPAAWRLIDATTGVPMAIIRHKESDFRVTVNGHTRSDRYQTLKGAVLFAVSEFNG
jgi:hypothetical protein